MEVLSVASCYGNRDKLRPDGPLGSNADYQTYSDLNRQFQSYFEPLFRKESSYKTLYMLSSLTCIIMNLGETRFQVLKER